MGGGADSINTEATLAETDPLLGHPSPKSSSTVSVEPVDEHESPKLRRVLLAVSSHWDKWKIVWVAGFWLFLFALGQFMSLPSKLRMLEAAICRRYYALENPRLMQMDADVPEEFCKVDEVQVELALVNTWLSVCLRFISLIVAVPWGIVADRKGRKLVLVAGTVGVLLGETWYYATCYFYRALPPRLVWASAAFYGIGGGETVLASILLAIMADAAPPHLRATVLYFIQGSISFAQMVGPLVGINLLKRFSYWPGATTGYITLLLSLIPLSMLPTTAMKSERHVAGGPEEIIDITGAEAEPLTRPVADELWRKRARDAVVSGASYLGRVGTFVVKTPSLPLALACLSISRLSVPLAEFLPQFASKRYGWSISDASYVDVVRAVITLVMVVIVLPTLHSVLRNRFKMASPGLERRIFQGSGPFISLGWFLVGWAITPPLFFFALIIYALGTGFRTNIEAYVSSSVSRADMAILFVIISVFDTLSMMLFTPVLVSTFRTGLHRGGHWVGLPFFIVSGCFVIAVVLSGFIGMKKPLAEEPEPIVAGVEPEGS